MDNFYLVQTHYFNQNYNEAFEICSKCAEQGDVKCQRFLGWIYYEGKAQKRDDMLAEYWFKQAIKKTDPEAFFGLASLDYGREKYSSAYKLFCKSADLGYIPGYRWAGMMCQFGIGIEQQPKKAFKLYKKAINGGNISAGLSLSSLYFHGYKGLVGKFLAIFIFIKYLVLYKIQCKKDENSQKLM